ncbi:phage baseplate assembly protein [uncultured Fibrobacter sp.]|uniref:phage baseplate assembly protein domain-containing protein n=1 Tax=uncultured Fibrobacter sp. TaxID=261512 RepID=UPI0025F01A10|nr:phage baseplate assembly protein [uncultured Fibrobacter sp.]
MMERLLNPIKARIRLMVGKCLISACEGLNVDISLLVGESRENVDFYQQYGFSSRPVGKVAGVALFVGGSRDNGVVVASRGEDDDMGVNLEPGEVSVHSRFGSEIRLKKDGSVVLKTSSNKFRIEGDLDVTGDVKAVCDGVFVTLTGHTHLVPNAGQSDKPTPGM